jgi:hypothetical protein
VDIRKEGGTGTIKDSETQWFSFGVGSAFIPIAESGLGLGVSPHLIAEGSCFTLVALPS